MSYWDQKAYAVEYGGPQYSVPTELNIPSSTTNSASVYDVESKSRKESPAEETKESITVPDVKRAFPIFFNEIFLKYIFFFLKNFKKIFFLK
jgi:hypothetical protein